MERRRWTWLLILSAVRLHVWAYDRMAPGSWVVGTDLEVECVVTEAGSDRPIAGARVDVQSEGGFYEERDEKKFVLTVDADGVARKVCHQSMCFGTSSGLGFSNSFAVHLPW